MNTEIIVQTQLSLMNECYQCQQLNELCSDCLEAKEARDAVIANELVDEGNEQYLHIPSKLDNEPSGHDWISNQVVTEVYVDRLTGEPIKTIRTELFEQSAWLLDRIFDLEGSITLDKSECICQACNYVINKHAVCPNCA